VICTCPMGMPRNFLRSTTISKPALCLVGSLAQNFQKIYPPGNSRNPGPGGIRPIVAQCPEPLSQRSGVVLNLGNPPVRGDGLIRLVPELPRRPRARQPEGGDYRVSHIRRDIPVKMTEYISYRGKTRAGQSPDSGKGPPHVPEGTGIPPGKVS
jgi:hypothetical protein